jgi:SOS-response transcriptional repressor LexA|tara:strand:- start:275 stop:544 length:270 start_codon:yes stop_codon:yes gene_type:complete
MKIKCNICEKTVEFSHSLSKKQQNVLRFIKEYEAKHNESPSYRNISEGLGYATPSAVFIIVERLVDKQFIEKRPYSARSLVLLKELPCG